MKREKDNALIKSIGLWNTVFSVTRRRKTMTDHKIGTREEWLAARLDLLKEEKALTRRSDELAQRRQRLPWVRIDKEYRFETDEGMASFADLFRGRSQLSSITSCSAPGTEAAAPHALRSRTALTALPCTLSTTTSR